MNRLTTDGRKIHARESITLNGMTKDELRQHYIEIFDRLQEYEVEEECGKITASVSRGKMLLCESAADVAEVVRGKWICVTGTFDTVAGVRMTAVTGYKCSVCGHSEIEKYPFCNCGAKMTD